MNSLRRAARHLKTQPIYIKPNPTKMSTFKIPGSNLQINTIPDLTQEDLHSFLAFKTWLNTLQQSLKRQENPSHEFHHDPYILRKIDIQSVDRFGTRLGFIKLKAEVSNGRGETLPGSVFLRGGSVGMLVSEPIEMLIRRDFFLLGGISRLYSPNTYAF
jgi:ADP-sugar diphosphatase